MNHDENIQAFLENSNYFAVVLSLFGFWIGIQIKKRWNHPLCNPLLIAILFVIGFLSLTNISYETYQRSGNTLSYLLTPATVCLAIPLYQQFQQFKENAVAVLSGITVGVLTNLILIFGISKAFALNEQLFLTLLPKSITTAIGLGVSAEYGGIPSITATAIILTGILGNMLGESLCKLGKITHPVAKGVALGTSAHAIGTSKAMEMGEVEGAMSSLSIVITGVLTILGISIFSTFYS